jgi:hypothetical protein
MSRTDIFRHALKLEEEIKRLTAERDAAEERAGAAQARAMEWGDKYGTAAGKLLNAEKEIKRLKLVSRDTTEMFGRLNNMSVHLSHCNFGEHKNSCKYGENNCPALSDAWSWFGNNLQEAERLRVKNDAFTHAAWNLIEALSTPRHADSGFDIGLALQELEDVLTNHRMLRRDVY